MKEFIKKRKKLTLIIILALLFLSTAGVIIFLSTESGKDFIETVKKGKEGSSDTFNLEKYIKPDYDVDGVLDESIWDDAVAITFGDYSKNADEVTFRYYYGERGITASFVVQDPYLCYLDNAVSISEALKYGDGVYIGIDTKNDNASVAQKDDFFFSFLVDGRYSVSQGNGSQFYGINNAKVDCVATVDGAINKMDGEEKDVSWTVEFFLAYENYGIDKDGIMGLTLAWGDSNKVGEARKYHTWHQIETTSWPDMYNPINKDGLAFAAPQGWVPSMGRFISDKTNKLVAEDNRAVAYYKGAKFNNGAGTVEATFDLKNADEIFKSSRFSGLLLGVKDVGETEAPGWETKDYYGLFFSNSETKPELVFASIRLVDGHPKWKQIASKPIQSVLPNFVEDRVCTVKVRKNGGWMEVYMKDSAGKYQSMFDIYEEDAINGDYVGIRAAVKGFAVRNISVTKDAPAAVTPYKKAGMTVHQGLVQKLDGNKLMAKTAGTTVTFGSLRNKYGTTELKSICTSLTLPEKPATKDDQIKGILLNYNSETGSQLILDYSRRNIAKEEDWEFYIRHNLGGKWGDVAFVMYGDANTTYDFRITPIENEKKAIEVLVEYKKSTDTVWKSTYCKKDTWVMDGDLYGIYTGTGNQQFGDFSVVTSDYTRLDTNRYKTVEGDFLGLRNGGVQVISNFSTVLDKTINVSSKNSYVLHTSMKMVEDPTNSIKGMVFNYDEKDKSYIILDYRLEKHGAYNLFARYFDGKKWGATKGFDFPLEVNEWYDVKLKVVNGKNSTEMILEYKTGQDEYKAVIRKFDFATSGRMVGYSSTKANGMQFGGITLSATTVISSGDARYDVVKGAFRRVDGGVQVANSNSMIVDTQINKTTLDSYAFESGFQILPQTAGMDLSGIMLNYNKEEGSYLLLDYHKEPDGKYKLWIRYYDGTSWKSAKNLQAILQENAWYDFKISVKNTRTETKITLQYKTGQQDYVSEVLSLGVTAGRQVGYIGDKANNMKMALFNEIIPSGVGVEWGDDWTDALSKQN